jgi:hypothetical protein
MHVLPVISCRSLVELNVTIVQLVPRPMSVPLHVPIVLLVHMLLNPNRVYAIHVKQVDTIH